MIVRDEIYGTIRFDDFEERIINTSEFQRLRRVKQLSVANLVYPGANHTRFEHSLGTAHLASLICQRLEFDKEISKKVKLAALLHDIGHTAFSHEGEDVLSNYIGDHEVLGKRKIAKGELGDILSENYAPRELSEIESSVHGSVISADLGADRMDYLKRDALNTGVAYGVVDTDRILDTLVFRKDGIAIDERGLEAAEFLLIARFMMFSAVYMHNTVRIATAMLHRAIAGSISDETLPPQRFAELGDEEALELMLSSHSGGKYAESLRNRTLYKEVASFSKGKIPPESLTRLEEELKEATGGDIVIDIPHSFFKETGIQVVCKGSKTQTNSHSSTNTSTAVAVPLPKLSSLVRSLKASEEERTKILVLCDNKTREESAAKINSIIGQWKASLLP
jgi:putative nucleotidyltransferase with HDIG domain